MLQRVQTLFLSVVLIACGLSFFLPFWGYSGNDYTYLVYLFSVKIVQGTSQNIMVGTIPIIVIMSICLLLTVVSIFSFKNRSLQLRLNNFNLLFTLFFIGTLYILIPSMIEEQLPLAVRTFNFGLILPLISLVSLIFANMFIKKDENLVKSADRLR